MKGHPVQDLHVGSAQDREIFNDVEAIELGPMTSHIGQVPTLRRSWTPHPLPAIECTVAAKDPVDRGDRGNVRGPLLHKLSVNRHRSELPQITHFSQLAAYLKNVILGGEGGLSGMQRSVRAIREVDAIQPLGSSSADPT